MSIHDGRRGIYPPVSAREARISRVPRGSPPVAEPAERAVASPSQIIPVMPRYAVYGGFQRSSRGSLASGTSHAAAQPPLLSLLLSLANSIAPFPSFLGFTFDSMRGPYSSIDPSEPHSAHAEEI